MNLTSKNKLFKREVIPMPFDSNSKFSFDGKYLTDGHFMIEAEHSDFTLLEPKFSNLIRFGKEFTNHHSKNFCEGGQDCDSSHFITVALFKHENIGHWIEAASEHAKLSLTISGVIIDSDKDWQEPQQRILVDGKYNFITAIDNNYVPLIGEYHHLQSDGKIQSPVVIYYWNRPIGLIRPTVQHMDCIDEELEITFPPEALSTLLEKVRDQSTK